MPRVNTNKKRPFVAVSLDAIEKGDIVFFFNASAMSAKDQYDHVAVVTGFRRQGKRVVPQITHATFNKTKTIKHVCETDLRPYASYLVFRHHNKKIAKRAAEVAQQWSQQGVSYDFKRLKLMRMFLSSVASLDDALKKNRDAYNQRGFLHSWKYASRDEQLFRKGSLRGFRCDQFVLLCFQVAERFLFHSLYFKKQDQMEGNRVSLKYRNPIITKNYIATHKSQLSIIEKPLRKFLKKSNTTQVSTRPVVPVSAIFTRVVSHVDQLRESCAPLDPKVSSPSVFLHYLTQGLFGGGGHPVNPDPGFVFRGVILGRGQSKDEFPGMRIINHDELWLKKQPGSVSMTRRDFDCFKGRDRFMFQAILRLRFLCKLQYSVANQLISHARRFDQNDRPEKKRRRLKR